jgi:hypothetical protein
MHEIIADLLFVSIFITLILLVSNSLVPQKAQTQTVPCNIAHNTKPREYTFIDL